MGENKENMGCILIKDGYFGWDKERELRANNYRGKVIKMDKGGIVNPRRIKESLRTKNSTVLKNINIRANKGEMIVIVGDVGAGKSTLANSIIGETILESGILNVFGHICYLSQIPWIINHTIRENITLQSTDEEYDIEKYNRILTICQLERDLDTFYNQNLTQVDPKTIINLSTEQKQKISIARALYSGADIYIIDDCLSALDVQASQSLFENVIKGEMGNSTRIFITQAIHFLNNSPQITKSKYSYISSLGNERWRNRRRR